MSSANNAIGYMSAIMMQGTAAANVSGVSNVQREPKASSNGFDLALNKASNNLTQTKGTDVSKKVETTSTGDSQTKSDFTTQVKDTDANQNGSFENNNTSVNDVDTANQTVTDTTAETTEVIEDAPALEVTEIVEEDTTVLTENDNTILEIIDITPEELPRLQETIREDVRELISQISEEFDIDEDDIVNAMQQLALMATDLLNPVNIQQVITQAAGPEQSIDLITDSDIYTSLQDLMEGAESMKDELMNEFDLSEDELQAAIDDTGRSFAGNFQEVVDTDQEEIPDTKLEPEHEPEIIVKEDITSKVPVKETKAPQSEAFTENSSVETPSEDKVQINTQGSKESGNKSLFHEGTQPQNLFNQVMNNITEAAAGTESINDVSYTDRAQMENIIRQITDRITISAGTEETSMELALHPASLGHVNILLTSGKDGITAKFTAQNQLVKEAVESQMVSLQQKFEEQGIKVTSVEVTIASHGFEQNLEQGNERNNDETNEGKKARGLRRINLAEIDEELAEEAASDAERIAVQMMQQNGNTVDYSA